MASVPSTDSFIPDVIVDVNSKLSYIKGRFFGKVSFLNSL